MAAYKARQIARIKDAVAAARLALRECGRYDPLSFAEVFIAHDGIQLPGRADAVEAQREVAEAVLRALRGGDPGTSEDVAREIRRAEQESRWVEQARSERVVAFRLVLGPKSAREAACEGLLKASESGLGPGLFGKYDIVVLKPECSDCSFVPVDESELEW